MGKQRRIYCLIILLLAGNVFAGIDAGSGKGTNFATPTVDTDAANKKYVDDNISGPGGIHNLMAVAHGDTTNSTPPARGSMIVGNATPLWNEFLIGANETVWVSDGTDPSWGTVDISGGTNLAVDTDHLKLTDDTLSLSDNEKLVAHSRQGSFLEQIDFTVSESGGTVTGSLEKEGGGDLTQFWSDDYDVLDCTGPVCTVDLTALVGTDTSPAASFVYILQSAKTTLVANTSFPANTVEHIRVASLVLQSAATTGTNGSLMVRNWNDPAFGITNPRGGDIVSSERVRKEHALHDSGVVLSITGSGTGTVTLDTTAGAVYQFNLQSFPAIDMAGADDIHLVNLSGSEYSTTSNLVAGITTLADAVTALGNNKYFNIVVWGVQNRTGETSHLMCNLPTGQYNSSLGGTTDSQKFSVHTIPSAFRGTGFLIAELTFQLTGGGTTWTTVQNKNLLGQTPTLVPGGGTTTAISIFSDSAFEVFDNGDDTKEGVFQLSGITTGNIRTLTWPNASGNLALTSQTDGTIDHGADLAGLTDDDHTQYMLDAGVSVDNTLPRFDGTDGRTMQPSGIVVDDSDNMSGVEGLTTADTAAFNGASRDIGSGIIVENAIAGGGAWYAGNFIVDGDNLAARPLRLQGGLDTPGMDDWDFIDVNDGNSSYLGSAERDGAGTLQWETASDRRIKTNISLAEIDPDILTKFSNLKISNFAMKKSPDAIGVGFIAQDLQEQFPKLVGTKTLYHKIDLTKGEEFDALTQILLNEASDAILSDTIEYRDVEVKVFDEELGKDVKVIESHRFRIIEQECLGVKGNMNIQFTMVIQKLIKLAQTQQAQIEDLINRVKVLEMQ